jgi:hypothetical protein
VFYPVDFVIRRNESIVVGQKQNKNDRMSLTK